MCLRRQIIFIVSLCYFVFSFSNVPLYTCKAMTCYTINQFFVCIHNTLSCTLCNILSFSVIFSIVHTKFLLIFASPIFLFCFVDELSYFLYFRRVKQYVTNYTSYFFFLVCDIYLVDFFATVCITFICIYRLTHLHLQNVSTRFHTFHLFYHKYAILSLCSIFNGKYR